MLVAPLPSNESERLAALYAYQVLDTPPETAFDEIIELASYISKMPISHIGLIDKDRQWFKARKGLQDDEVPRQVTFCSYTINGSEPVIVKDASKDTRFADNPYVTAESGIRFYAGFPLVTEDGNSIGTLCVIDTVPNALDDQQLKALDILSKQVIKLLDERSRSLQLQELAELERRKSSRLEELISTQKRIMSILGHDTRGPLFYVNWMIKSMREHKVKESEMEGHFQMIGNQLDATLILIEELLDWSRVNVLNSSDDQLPFAVQETVEEIIEPLRVLADKKGIVIRNEVPEELVGLRYERIVRFIVRNLLVNAIKFTRQGSVEIKASKYKNNLLLEISDTGIGMTKDQVNNFFNGEIVSTKGTQDEEGSGLGLVLVNEFLQQINGSLDVSSMPGKGSVMLLKIPMK